MAPASPSLACSVVASLLLASCGGSSGGGGNTPVARTAAAPGIEQGIHDQVNTYRASQGMNRLKRDAALDRLARQHSRDMLSRSSPGNPKVDHRGFSGRFDQATAAVGANAMAENVYSQPKGGGQARSIVNGWIASKGHLANIRKQWALSGVGIETDSSGRVWATQIFTSSGRSR
jgi:uncharacterized protein YkwD